MEEKKHKPLTYYFSGPVAGIALIAGLSVSPVEEDKRPAIIPGGSSQELLHTHNEQGPVRFPQSTRLEVTTSSATLSNSVARVPLMLKTGSKG